MSDSEIQNRKQTVHGLWWHSNTVFSVLDQYGNIVQKWNSIMRMLRIICELLVAGFLILIVTLDDPVAAKWCVGIAFVSILLGSVIGIFDIIFDFGSLDSNIKESKIKYSEIVQKLKTIQWEIISTEEFAGEIDEINEDLKKLEKTAPPEHVLLFSNALRRLTLPLEFDRTVLKLMDNSNISHTVVKHYRSLVLARELEMDKKKEREMKIADERYTKLIHDLGPNRVSDSDIREIKSGGKELVIIRVPHEKTHVVFGCCAPKYESDTEDADEEIVTNGKNIPAVSVENV